MSVSVTLVFPDVLAAADALGRMSYRAPAALQTAIAAEDRPDVGAPEAPVPAAADDPAVIFAGAPVLPQSPAAPVVPPPPPAATVPSAGIVQTAAPSAVLDSTGLPWDSRIHAGSKGKNKDGSWTAKRNIDPQFKATVEADLRGLPAPAPVAQATPPAAPTPPTPPAPPASGAESFAQYMTRVSASFAANPLKAQEAMTKVLAPHGLQHVGQLAGRPDLIPVVDVAFTAAMAAA